MHGRSMLTFEQLADLFNAVDTPVPRGFSDTSGWRYAESMSRIVLKEIARLVSAAQFMGFSLDESTDNGGARCGHHRAFLCVEITVTSSRLDFEMLVLICRTESHVCKRLLR